MQHVPNALTGLRGLAGVAVGVLLLGPGGPFWAAACLCFVLAAVTDFLDGWLARRLDAHTDLGRVLDPLADKILVTAGLAGTLGGGLLGPVSSLAALAIVLREMVVPALRAYQMERGRDLPVLPLARIKTALQMVAVLGLLLSGALPDVGFGTPAALLLWLAAAVTVWTGGVYAMQALAGQERT